MPTALLMEDEPVVMNVMRVLLERERFVVLTATTGEQATQMSGSHRGAIQLLVADVILGSENGAAVAGKILSDRPEAVCVLTSGYPPDMLQQQGWLEGAHSERILFLQKPFTLRDFSGTVQACLGRLHAAACS